MKKTASLAAALLLGICAVPANAAGPELDKAVALSAPDSKASLSSICEAVYKAVKEAPNEPDKVFESVISQRTTWKASECYAIMRAILLARPDLAGNLNSYVAANKGGKEVMGGNEMDSSETSSAELDSALYNMLSTLYHSSLEDGVAEEAINSLMLTISGVYEQAYYGAVGRNAAGAAAPNTNSALPSDYIEIIVTPPPTSRSN